MQSVGWRPRGANKRSSSPSRSPKSEDHETERVSSPLLGLFVLFRSSKDWTEINSFVECVPQNSSSLGC